VTDVLPATPSFLSTPDDDYEIADESLSDGRDWDSSTILRELQHHLAQGLIHTYEVGRRLLWTKRQLGHGAFQVWCEENLDIGRFTRQRCMQVAVFFCRHPGLLRQLGSTSVKKVLALQSLPQADLEALEAGGTLAGGLSAVEAAQLPYVELKKIVEDLRGERDKLIADNQRLQSDLSEEKIRVADATNPKKLAAENTDGKRLERLEKAYQEYRDAQLRLTLLQDELAQLIVDDREAMAQGSDKRVASPQLHQAVALVFPSMEHLGRHSHERWRTLVGEAVADAEYVEALRAANALGAPYSPDLVTALPGFDDSTVVSIGSGDRRPKAPRK
jgi:hypothetical protein